MSYNRFRKGRAHSGVNVELAGTDRWMGVLLDESDVETARWALANDAWCIAALSDSLDQFQEATRALVTGSAHFLPMSFARMIANGRGATSGEAVRGLQSPPDHTPLTAREREVLSFVAQGLSNTEIADEMGISVHTVRTHLASMATKMDANNRLRMVAKATMYGYPEAGTRARAL